MTPEALCAWQRRAGYTEVPCARRRADFFFLRGAGSSEASRIYPGVGFMTTASVLDSRISTHHQGGAILTWGVIALLAVGVIYTGVSLYDDLVSTPMQSVLPYILLGVALLIALGFEMCNGFHDTSNAVATVIYTHSLTPNLAVVWSGLFNFIGVLTSSGLVAFGIISLLPVELILQVGSEAGFAMVFALLIAAIIWNFGTWYLGIPNSSSLPATSGCGS
jgi:hypothetical protein